MQSHISKPYFICRREGGGGGGGGGEGGIPFHAYTHPTCMGPYISETRIIPYLSDYAISSKHRK